MVVCGAAVVVVVVVVVFGGALVGGTIFQEKYYFRFHDLWNRRISKHLPNLPKLAD